MHNNTLKPIKSKRAANLLIPAMDHTQAQQKLQQIINLSNPTSTFSKSANNLNFSRKSNQDNLSDKDNKLKFT